MSRVTNVAFLVNSDSSRCCKKGASMLPSCFEFRVRRGRKEKRERKVAKKGRRGRKRKTLPQESKSGELNVKTRMYPYPA